MVKEARPEDSKSTLKYVVIAIAVVAVIGVIFWMFKGGKGEASISSEFPGQIGNFEPAWHFFMGFECATNPALSIQTYTVRALKDFKIPGDTYLDCWYKVGENYIKRDILEDGFGEEIGTFNPNSAYDVTLCCQLVDSQTGDEASKTSCKTIWLDKFCK